MMIVTAVTAMNGSFGKALPFLQSSTSEAVTVQHASSVRQSILHEAPLNVTCCCSGFNVTNAILHLSAHNGSFGGPALCPFCES